MKMLTLDEYEAFLKNRFGGILESGSHSPNGKACVLESYAVAQGLDWTDDPESLDMWDLRPLNDITVNAAIRAKYIAPVLIAYQGSRKWPIKRQKAVSAKLAILTVQRIISELPGISDEIRVKCRKAKTLSAAAAAARKKFFILACQIYLDAAKS